MTKEQPTKLDLLKMYGIDDPQKASECCVEFQKPEVDTEKLRSILQETANNITSYLSNHGSLSMEASRQVKQELLDAIALIPVVKPESV